MARVQNDGNVIDTLIETLQGLKENGGAVYLLGVSISHSLDGSQIDMSFRTVGHCAPDFADAFQEERLGLPEPIKAIGR